MLSLLDRCTRDAEGDYSCYSCAASNTCGSMYDGTQGDVTVAYSNIWTSTPCTLPPPLSGQAAYLADLDDGTLTCFWADQSVGYPLCISD